MSKIIDRTGKGSNISQSENDSNLDSLHGINQGIAGASHTVDITDQGDTLEFTNGGAVAVTLDSIATILAAAHTSDFKVTLVSIGAATVVTITPDALDSINTGVLTIVLTENEYVTIQTDSTNNVWNIVVSSNAVDSGLLGGLSSSQFLRSDANDTASGDIDFSGAIDFTGTLGIGGVQITSTAAELNILDGALITTAELNNIDGSAASTATTIVDADRLVLNDNGTMVQSAVTDLDTYVSGTIKTLTNKTLTSPVLNGTLSGTAFLDEDDMSSDSAIATSSQQSIKAYSDGKRVIQTIDTTGVAEWTSVSANATEIVITIVNIDTAGTLLFTVGHSASYQSAGYVQGVLTIANVTGEHDHEITKSTNDFELISGTGGGDISGTITLTLHDAATFMWTVNGILYENGITDDIHYIAGHVVMTDTLTRFKVGRAGTQGSIGAIIKS